MARFGAIKTTFCGLACCGAMANAYAALGNGPFEIGTGVLQEELSWLQAESTIFSASRHEEKVSRTAAAVFVFRRRIPYPRSSSRPGEAPPNASRDPG